MNQLALVTATALSLDPDARAREYAARSKAPATVKSYATAIRSFEKWCRSRGIKQPFPASPSAVAIYLADCARTAKVSTLTKALTAINEANRFMGADPVSTSSEVAAVLKGIRRTHGVAKVGKDPISIVQLRKMIDALPEGPLGVRDRALLLVGFAGALRRSEIVSINAGDLEFKDEGVVIKLRRSKTDQLGEGREIGIPHSPTPTTCPVAHLRRWLELAKISTGPVFRSMNKHGHISPNRLSDRGVCRIVKRAAVLIGLDADQLGAHSLRAGFATEAARAGVSELAIMRQTGHRSVETLRIYVRHGSLFTQNAASQVGL